MRQRITIKVKVEDRWCDNGEFDDMGQLIRWPNPNPTVVWAYGGWSRELGQGVMMKVTASKCRELTGHIIYGGDWEPRGYHNITILYGDYNRLKSYRSQGVTVERTRSRNTGRPKVKRALPPSSKLKALQEGKTQQLKGVAPRVRKNRG